MTRVKICGITNEADRRAAVDAGADALGFIASVPVETPREIDPERAADLVASAPPFVTTVLVTMPATVADAIDLVDGVRPDVLQLHGTPERGSVESLAEEIDADLVVATDAGDPDRARRYDDVTDGILVDSTSEDGGGGTGQTHDWTTSRDLADALDSPLILAGGLTPENVADATDAVDPFAVDVASGVEESGGRKDHDAVSAFVSNAKRSRVTHA